jgi:hypothetical protein
MRTSRRGLTVIELVLILLAIGVLAYFAFRYLGRDDAAATAPGLDSAAVTPTAPAGPLADRLELLAPLDSTAAPGDTVLVRVRATTVAGTGVANATVTFEVTAGGGSVVPASVATNDLGETEARWATGAAGAQELRATVTGSPAATATVTLRGATADTTAGGAR